MLNDLPLIYWDSCVPLAYINGDSGDLFEVVAHGFSI